MPWTVAKFWSTNEVEAIPTSWVDKDGRHCFYPNIDNANCIQKLIKTEAAPENDWAKYEIKIMAREVFTTYKLASVKATRACKVSDLDEEVFSTTHLPEKRRRKKKIYTSSSDSEGSLRGAPKFPNRDQAISPNKQEISVDYSVIPQNYQEVQNFAKSDAPEEVVLENNNSDYQEAFQKQCLSYLVKIKKRLEDQDKEIADMKTMLDTMVQKGMSVTNLPGIEDLGILNLLPANDAKMLATLEETLSDKNAHDKMVIHLTMLGGREVKEFARRCLKRIIDDNLAQQYSLHGHKGKKAFYPTNIYSCVRDAAQKQFNVTLKEVETITAIWLTKAPERVKTALRKTQEREQECI